MGVEVMDTGAETPSVGRTGPECRSEVGGGVSEAGAQRAVGLSGSGRGSAALVLVKHNRVLRVKV